MKRASRDGRTDQCIYCGSAVNMHEGQGDHIIPAALGEFRGDERFRRICRPCNQRIGVSEQHMLRCGPESLFRWYVQPASRRRRATGGVYTGQDGPVHLADSGDHSVLVHPSRTDPATMRPTDNLSILGKDGREHHLKLHLRMSVDDLKSRVEREKIGPIKTVWFSTASSADYDALEKVVQQIWPKARARRLKDTDVGVYTTEGQVQFKLDKHYFRAKAKIAFHYYLAHTRRGFRGDELIFTPIRRFILGDGEIDQFFGRADAKFYDGVGRVPDGRSGATSEWCHYLAAEDATTEVAAFIHLSCGPDFPGIPHTIKLADLDSLIRMPWGTDLWAHRYSYDSPQPEKGYAGRVEPIPLQGPSRGSLLLPPR